MTDRGENPRFDFIRCPYCDAPLMETSILWIVCPRREAVIALKCSRRRSRNSPYPKCGKISFFRPPRLEEMEFENESVSKLVFQKMRRLLGFG
jgi:hypothetical protein